MPAAIKNDLEAWLKAHWEELSSMAWGTAHIHGSELQDHEDHLHTAVLRLLEAKRSGISIASPVGFVLTKIRFQIIDAARDGKKERTHLHRLAPHVKQQTGPVNWEELSQLQSAIQNLSPSDRFVWSLHIDGHSPTEIALLMHLKPVTVRKRLSRVRERLRKVLGHRD